MACTIVETVGSASANSYATIAEGNTFADTHLYFSDWADADDDTKCKALQMATRLLDQWYEWNGFAATDAQALLWPRTGVIGPDGYLEASDAIPVRIKQGTIELAKQLIAEDRTADSSTGAKGIKSLRAGPVSLEFMTGVASKPIPDAVAGYVGVYGSQRGASGGAVTLQRA